MPLFAGIDGLAGGGHVRACECISDGKRVWVWEGDESISKLVFIDWVMHVHYSIWLLKIWQAKLNLGVSK